MRTRYLHHLGVADRQAPSLEWLAELQAAHLMRVPFENLDVFHRRGVDTDPTSSVDKILSRGRGGWCFELNGAFGRLLEWCGFDVAYVSCRVHGDDGWGPELDHCGLVVHLDAARWYVDVGFGDWSLQPLPLDAGVHTNVPADVQVTLDGPGFVLATRVAQGVWRPHLSGTFQARGPDEFTTRSTYLQTEPGLRWTTGPFATRATDLEGSRVTLRPGVRRVRNGAGPFVDSPVDDATWSEELARHFGIDDRLTRD